MPTAASVAFVAGRFVLVASEPNGDTPAPTANDAAISPMRIVRLPHRVFESRAIGTHAMATTNDEIAITEALAPATPMIDTASTGVTTPMPTTPAVSPRTARMISAISGTPYSISRITTGGGSSGRWEPKNGPSGIDRSTNANPARYAPSTTPAAPIPVSTQRPSTQVRRTSGSFAGRAISAPAMIMLSVMSRCQPSSDVHP